MKGRPIKYSAAELAWLEANATLVIGEYHAQFCEKFGRDVSRNNLHALRKRNGWPTGRTGPFKKGERRADNPSRKGHCPSGCEKGWFRKGAVPANSVPMWSERIGKDGYVEMKVPRENPHTGHKTRFMHKHRYIWEEAHGPLPDGMVIKFLDGDRTNCALENLEAVPRAILPLLSARWHGTHYDSAPNELKPTIMATAKLRHAINEVTKGGAAGEATKEA